MVVIENQDCSKTLIVSDNVTLKVDVKAAPNAYTSVNLIINDEEMQSIWVSPTEGMDKLRKAKNKIIKEIEQIRNMILGWNYHNETLKLDSSRYFYIHLIEGDGYIEDIAIYGVRRPSEIITEFTDSKKARKEK